MRVTHLVTSNILRSKCTFFTFWGESKPAAFAYCLCIQLCISLGLSPDEPGIKRLVESDSMERAISFTSLTIIVKTCGVVNW